MMKKLSKVWNGYILEVEYGLQEFDGQMPYFSLTAMGWKANKKGKKDARYHDCVFGGCCHEQILKAAPEFADLARLHLSHIDGSPMYPVENGLYHLGVTSFSDVVYNREACMHHFRISADESDKLHKALFSFSTDEEKRAFLERKVAEMRPRWKAEADAAIQKYGLAVSKEYDA